jgi:dihydropyrimidinase
MKILIKNGTIVTSSETYQSDIYISDGVIKRIEPGIEQADADRIIDAVGHYIFPGGVDPHVHMHLPSPAGFSSDDFLSGSIAALHGGTTTLIDFVTPERGQHLTNALEKRIAEAEESLIDFTFHMTPVEWNEDTNHEIIECIREGINSFKVYMAYRGTIGLSDNDILNVMNAVGRNGGIVALHCESGEEIETLRNKLYEEGHSSLFYHPVSRPGNLEAEAVKRATEMAEKSDCPIYIVHLSAKESLPYIKHSIIRGTRIFAETCPQYLLLDDSKYNGDFDNAAPFVISPPLRRKDDIEALWFAINEDLISTVGSDHCPFNLHQKKKWINDFRKIPGGAGGVEHRLALIYTYGVLENRITLNRMADLFSTQPARIFGLYPRKGTLEPGSDADMVIWNPEPENIISAKTHNQNCDINIYEGIKTTGCAEYVIAGGRIIIDRQKFVQPDIKGRFLRRKNLIL